METFEFFHVTHSEDVLEYFHYVIYN